MNVWSKVRGELIDIIQWVDESNDTLVYRFERYHNQIKYGAQLTVREGQAALFVNEGKLADVFYPGMYALETRNLPILSTLQGWKYGFDSPFRAEVYFCSTRQFTNLKWGTMNPIIVRDEEFGPVRLRAFGTYVMRVKDPAVLLRQLVGTDSFFTVDEIVDQLRNIITSRFANIIGQRKTPLLDLAGRYSELGETLANIIRPEFESYGLELSTLLVENISLPRDVEEALDRRTSMGLIGNLAAYTQFNVANSIPEAAKNPGGLASTGAGIGMGFVLAGPVAQSVAGQSATSFAPVLYYVAVNGQQTGPHDMQSLSSQVISGELKRQTLIWTQGMTQWTQAGQVPALAKLFEKIPPPIPA
jgi:membrane protease subunit (stomatin/prohibitin family)